MDILQELALPLLLTTLVLTVLVTWQALRLRKLRRVERDAELARRDLVRRERDQENLTDFIREFPELSRQLHSRLSQRQLGEVLLSVLQRLFEPAQVLVVLARPVRRDSTGGRELRVVASSGLPGKQPLGALIELGEGEIGWVAQHQQLMDRADFEREPTLAKRAPNDQLRGMRLETVAPMVVAEKTFGVIAISAPGRSVGARLELIRAIAQLGALSAYNALVYGQFKRQAQIDKLTGAFNKASILEGLSRELVELQRSESTLSIFLFDIDNFKVYNDQNGHLAGDKLLRELSALVSEVVRAEDVLGRFGGEEFLLIFPETDQAAGFKAADKVRRRIAAHPFEFAENQPLGCISVSGGVATYPTSAESSVQLLKLADEALYRAKAKGRDRVESALPPSLGNA